jgi:hypothetical protein
MIKIPEIVGVFTNADKEDIPEKYATELENFIPRFGKLEKTFGFGVKIDTAETSFISLVVFLNDNLATPKGSGTGYAIIGIKQTANVTDLFYWDSDSWENIDSMLENTLDTDYYQNALIPIIQHNKIIRFLPGNVGEFSGNEAKGIWIGHVDRDFFDGIYVADTDFNSGFYSEDTEIVAPDISDVTATPLQGGTWTKDDGASPNDGVVDADEVETPKYYKFSNIYDGIQESMLSETIRVPLNFAHDLYVKLEFDITEATHNKRITGRKIYRADSPDADFNHIHTIDFLRKTTDIKQGTTGAYLGINTAYIPELSTYNFDGVSVYNIYAYNGVGGYIGGTVTDISGATLSGTGHTIFRLSAGSFGGVFMPNSGFNEKWYLSDDGAVVENSNTGFYGGTQVIIINDTISEEAIGGVIWIDDVESGIATTLAADAGSGKVTFTSNDHELLVGDVVMLSGFSTNAQYNGTFVVTAETTNTFTVVVLWGSNENGEWQHIGNERIVADIFEKAVLVAPNYSNTNSGAEGGFLSGSANVSTCTNKPWVLMAPSKGLYKVVDNTGSVTYTFYDPVLDVGAAHTLLNAVSVKVNGKFAVVLKGRLFQFNIVLDPGDENEIQTDWLSYSEYDQVDVNPVSNVLPIVDQEGGEGTGMGVSFGSLILFKKHAILKLDIVDPTDPTTWILLESVFKRGNIADSASGEQKGIVQVGDSIYFCSYDGIYRIDANMVAATDATPLIRNRISEPINDVYIALSDANKALIKGAFNQRENEIIWRLSSTEVWAYNIDTKEWRQFDSSHDPDYMCLDEEGDFIFYDTSDSKVYSANIAEEVGCKLTTKFFRMAEYTDREQLVNVRYLKVRYKSTSALTVNIYVDEEIEDEGSIAKTGTLTASTDIATAIIAVRYWCQTMKVTIIDSVTSSTDTVIYSIEIIPGE